MSRKVSSIILASTSPHRRALLDATGISYRAESPVDAESSVTDPDPKLRAQRRARQKALSVAKHHPGALVIGGDQVLSHRGLIYDKARTSDEAMARLQEFSGNTHELHSGISLCIDGDVIRETVVTSCMTMHALTTDEITAYVATDEWRGCVGCYQFENKGGLLFKKVQGTHSAIIGLPLQELFHCLRDCGIQPLVNPQGPWDLRLSQ